MIWRRRRNVKDKVKKLQRKDLRRVKRERRGPTPTCWYCGELHWPDRRHG